MQSLLLTSQAPRVCPFPEKQIRDTVPTTTLAGVHSRREMDKKERGRKPGTVPHPFTPAAQEAEVGVLQI